MELDRNSTSRDNEISMLKRTEGHFKGHDDFDLFYQAWSPVQIRGTLVLTHGLGEHSECYNRLSSGLQPSGWEIFAWDLRGHGRSEGKRGVVGNFLDYCKDLVAFIQFIKQKKSDKPLVVIGHSMGGLVTLRTLMEFSPPHVAGLILSSPLLGIAVPVPKFKESAGRLAARLLPNLTLFNEIQFENLTRDQSIIGEYQKDTLRHDRISTALYVAMLENMEWVMNNAAKIALPLYFQQAGNDRVVSREKAITFFNHVKSKDKEMAVYEDYYHEIYNDIGREKAYADMKNWLVKRWV